MIRETGEVQENGLEEIYVNAKIDDGSDVAELMRIFKEPDAYDFEKFPKVSKRKKQFKESEGGDMTMCDLVENSYELVRASIVSLSDEELQKIYLETKS